MTTATAIKASDIPCHATFVSDYNYSTEWGNKLIEIWIAARKGFVAEGWTVPVFQDVLREAILEELDIEDAFLQGCAELGIEGDVYSELYDQYKDAQRKDAVNLIPSGLHAELCWIPEWDGMSLDSLFETHGLRSDKWRSNYIEDVQPGPWLEIFLKLVNCSSVDLIGEAISEAGDAGRALAEKCAKANFKVAKDQTRRQILSPAEVISAIENANVNTIPMCHCEIDVRALFNLDPTHAMRLSTNKEGKVHVGFHEGINGCGYMDTYDGEVVIPPHAVGFLSALRWKYGIDATYGLFKPCFHTTPVAVAVGK